MVDWCNCSLTEAVRLNEDTQAWEKFITVLNARMDYEREEKKTDNRRLDNGSSPARGLRV